MNNDILLVLWHSSLVSIVEYLSSTRATIGSLAKRRNTMPKEFGTPSVSYMRRQFGTFFERVMVLYNLSFNKEEESHKAEDVKRFAKKLFEADRISEYIKTVIDDAIENFALLLPGKMKRDDPYLEYLDAWVSLSISDINSEIGELIH